MKNVVLKVPTPLFVVLVLLPLLIFALQIISGEKLIQATYYGVLSIVGSLVASIWLFSIVDYFQSKATEFKFTRLIYFLLTIDVLMDLLFSFDVFTFDGLFGVITVMTRTVVYCTSTVLIVLLVRQVFYERAVWFIVLEILIVIVGITTLTPEIKRNELEAIADEG